MTKPASVGTGTPRRLPDQRRTHESARAARRHHGFTLIELMAAITIIGALIAIATPRYHDLIDRGRVAKAIGDISVLQTELSGQDTLPDGLAGIGRTGMLDPWGNPYVYYKFPAQHGNAPPGGARKDRFIVPLNSTYDVYSMGPDGQTALPLTAKAARDDIVRAADGSFIGIAASF